jgi:PIN domain nuclease of toxin-antitoxin system
MSVAMLDTHIAIGLYAGKVGGLSPRAMRIIDNDPLTLSPAVMLEVELMHEIRRVRVGGAELVETLLRDFDVTLAPDDFPSVAREALALGFTRDPFDRLITAHSSRLRAPLLTRHEDIRRFYRKALC